MPSETSHNVSHGQVVTVTDIEDSRWAALPWGTYVLDTIPGIVEWTDAQTGIEWSISVTFGESGLPILETLSKCPPGVRASDHAARAEEFAVAYLTIRVPRTSARPKFYERKTLVADSGYSTRKWRMWARLVLTPGAESETTASAAARSRTSPEKVAREVFRAQDAGERPSVAVARLIGRQPTEGGLAAARQRIREATKLGWIEPTHGKTRADRKPGPAYRQRYGDS